MNQGFHPVHFELMQAAYGTEEKPEYVGQICSYLIRTQQFDTKFHHWYEKGIGLELRITGLYEAYLMSLDEREIASVPKIIRMYFQYDSNLPYRKMAILYNNIIASKESEPEIYEQYRRVMSRFAMEQIEQEHVDDNLAVVYEDMLELGLVNEELAKCLSNILFAHKLVIMQPHMVRAIVYQKQMKDPQIVPIVNGCAYVSLFCREYAILFEDGKGQRYIHNLPGKIRLVFRIQLLCKQHSPEKFFLFGIKPMMIRLFPKMGNNIRKFLRCQCRTFLQIRSGIHQGIQPVRDTVDISLAFPIFKQNGIFPAEKGHVGTGGTSVYCFPFWGKAGSS